MILEMHCKRQGVSVSDIVKIHDRLIRECGVVPRKSHDEYPYFDFSIPLDKYLEGRVESIDMFLGESLRYDWEIEDLEAWAIDEAHGDQNEVENLIEWFKENHTETEQKTRLTEHLTLKVWKFENGLLGFSAWLSFSAPYCGAGVPLISGVIRSCIEIFDVRELSLQNDYGDPQFFLFKDEKVMVDELGMLGKS